MQQPFVNLCEGLVLRGCALVVHGLNSRGKLQPWPVSVSVTQVLKIQNRRPALGGQTQAATKYFTFVQETFWQRMSTLWHMLRGDQLKAEDSPLKDKALQEDQMKAEEAKQKYNKWVRFAA
jgi:hypothetical protein